MVSKKIVKILLINDGFSNLVIAYLQKFYILTNSLIVKFIGGLQGVDLEG